MDRQIGTVSWFCGTRGRGFVIPPLDGPDLHLLARNQRPGKAHVNSVCAPNQIEYTPSLVDGKLTAMDWVRL